MRSRHWPYALAALLALPLAACSGPGASEQPLPRMSAPEARQEAPQAIPVLPVDVLILTDARGHGNTLWEPQSGFLPLVISGAEQALAGTVHFTLESVATTSDPEGYRMEQWEVLRRYRHLRVPGRLLFVVSGPDTQDTAGFSYTIRSDAPYVVIRARVQSLAAVDDTAAILVHELGHNLGLTHDGALHADNYHALPAGREALRTWLTREVLD